jgi:hypothetical protein
MKRFFIPAIVILFVLLSAVFFVLKQNAPEYKFNVMMTGNVVMAVLSVASFFLVTKQIDNRPEAFVRGVYSASLLKLMVCMAALLVYVVMNRKEIHKPTIFVLMGIYAAYSIVETTLLSKMARGTK